MPAVASRTNAPTATSIITTSTIARWIFMVSRSLPAVGQASILRLGTVTSTQDVAPEGDLRRWRQPDLGAGGRRSARPTARRGVRALARTNPCVGLIAH